MKKIFLVVLDKYKEKSLQSLRDLGVVHVEIKQLASNNELKNLEDKENLLKRTLLVFKNFKAKNTGPGLEEDNLAQALHIAGETLSLADRTVKLKEEIDRLQREKIRLMPWGDFDPAVIAELNNKGVAIKLYTLTKDELASLPKDTNLFIIKDEKTLFEIAVVNPSPDFFSSLSRNISDTEFLMPEMSLEQINKQEQKINHQLKEIEEKHQELAQKQPLLEKALEEINTLITFEKTKDSLQQEGSLSVLTGYIPIDTVKILQSEASQEGWALLILDPSKDDAVPTLIKNSKAVSIIKPMFDFLGVTPNYWEYDISLWFLIFFSIFFAMIIGDAGYGFICLALTIIARLKLKKSPPEPFFLLFVTSICTIIWGVITGNYFASPAIANTWPFSQLIIKQIATFPVEEIDTGQTIMRICFIIGLIHLSIARIQNFIKKFPTLKCIGELGWFFILLGGYFVVKIIVLGDSPETAIFKSFPKLTYMVTAKWSIMTGFISIIIFAEQEGNFLKGIVMGLAKILLTFLDCVSALAHIISYVRLFAVGLASVEAAKSFNEMALSLGFSFPAGLGTALILLSGHLLNIIMGSMALIVHGVRLNMLEFSGHLGMEWSGIPYAPFKNNSKEN